ncbi:amidohydrolase [uncultured Peptoniphilus sp.]|uniref:amidohydrolase n=1 Tax=uncultured Peptoniphilus sp. TaxID=254354 RepID=UPI0028040ABE|nr:amidohydrolase [uncultured Peptoniphilus sp.]
MNINEIILSKTKEVMDYAVKMRRYFHENAELSSKEVNTSKVLKEEIKKLGLEINEVVNTGFYSILDTGKPGKTVGIRADIDALPVKENENNLNGKRIVCSLKDGVMHACGHDGHMAILLSVAKILVENKDLANGKIVFIFEEGEEIGSGIDSMIEALKSVKIDAIYGTHLTSFMNTGEISVDAGPVMAGCGVVRFNVVGRGGHGSRPDLSISPIFAAASIVNGLATAWANQIDVTKTVTLGLGSINGGSTLAPNVIPDKVEITGTLRFFDMEEGHKAMEIVKDVSENIARANRCTIEIDDRNGVAGNPVVNDKHLSEVAQSGLNEILPGSLKTDVKWFASESFNKYSKIAPSLFAFVGIRNEELGSGAEHHNEYFDLDENGLSYAIAATLKFVNKYQEEA